MANTPNVNLENLNILSDAAPAYDQIITEVVLKVNNNNTKLDTNIGTLRTQNGVEVLNTISQTLSGAINEHEIQINDVDVNVKSFGAVGDGIIDDTQAIQNAFATSKSIKFPRGDYKITSPIDINSNTNIRGNNAKIISTGQYIFKNTNLVENINIEKLRFEGTTTSIIYLPNAKNINILNCIFNNGVIPINIGDTLCDGLNVEKCIFTNFTSFGLWLHNQLHVSICDNYFKDVNDSNINISQIFNEKAHAIIENNTIICGAAFIAGHSVISTMVGSTTVRNNKVVNGTTAIVSHANDAGNDLGIKHYVYEGNYFIDCKVGINVNLDTNSIVNISKNHFDGFEIGLLIHNPDYATFDGLGDIIITDNYFDGGDTTYTQYQVPASIKIWFANNCIIANNLIKNPTYCGIMIRDKCENIKVVNNIILNHLGIQCSDQTLYYGAPILIQNASSVQMKNIDITNNKIDGFLTSQSSITAGGLAGGIVVYGKNTDTTLTKNIKIFDNEIMDGISNAIKCNYSDGVFGKDNIIVNTLTDSELTGLTNSFIDDIKFNKIVV